MNWIGNVFLTPKTLTWKMEWKWKLMESSCKFVDLSKEYSSFDPFLLYTLRGKNGLGVNNSFHNAILFHSRLLMGWKIKKNTTNIPPLCYTPFFESKKRPFLFYASSSSPCYLLGCRRTWHCGGHRYLILRCLCSNGSLSIQRRRRLFILHIESWANIRDSIYNEKKNLLSLSFVLRIIIT